MPIKKEAGWVIRVGWKKTWDIDEKNLTLVVGLVPKAQEGCWKFLTLGGEIKNDRNLIPYLEALHFQRSKCYDMFLISLVFELSKYLLVHTGHYWLLFAEISHMINVTFKNLHFEYACGRCHTAVPVNGSCCVIN